MHVGEATCRSYRFGHVTVDVFPELITIAVPYGAEHESFVDASMFVERYTHGASATVVEDDDQRLELHVYPNTENLVSGNPCELPPLDPRIALWDEPSRRPVVVESRVPRPPLMIALHERVAYTEQYVQELATRTAIGLLEALPKTILSLIR
jgi:hypothetical protein